MLRPPEDELLVPTSRQRSLSFRAAPGGDLSGGEAGRGLGGDGLVTHDVPPGTGKGGPVCVFCHSLPPRRQTWSVPHHCLSRLGNHCSLFLTFSLCPRFGKKTERYQSQHRHDHWNITSLTAHPSPDAGLVINLPVVLRQGSRALGCYNISINTHADTPNVPAGKKYRTAFHTEIMITISEFLSDTNTLVSAS